MKILLGVGGSPLSEQALEETIEHARAAGDDVTVAIFDSEEVDATMQEVESRVRATLDEEDFEAELRFVPERPASSLIEIAEREGYDRIVLGAGERSALGKIELGSIAEFVLLNSHTPVTLIR